MLNKQNSPAGWTARPPGGPRLPVGRVSRLEGFSLVSGGPEVEVQLVPRDGPNLEDTVWRKSCWLATASQAREPNSGRRRLTIVLAIPQNWQKMCSSIERERSKKEREEERKGGRGNKTRQLQKVEEEKKKKAMGKRFYCVIPSGLLMPGPAQTFSFSPPLVSERSTHTWSEFVERFCCLNQCSYEQAPLRNVSLLILFQNSCFIGKNISLMFSNQVEKGRKVREGTGILSL